MATNKPRAPFTFESEETKRAWTQLAKEENVSLTKFMTDRIVDGIQLHKKYHEHLKGILDIMFDLYRSDLTFDDVWRRAYAFGYLNGAIIAFELLSSRLNKEFDFSSYETLLQLLRGGQVPVDAVEEILPETPQTEPVVELVSDITADSLNGLYVFCEGTSDHYLFKNGYGGDYHVGVNRNGVTGLCGAMMVSDKFHVSRETSHSFLNAPVRWNMCNECLKRFEMPHDRLMTLLEEEDKVKLREDDLVNLNGAYTGLQEVPAWLPTVQASDKKIHLIASDDHAMSWCGLSSKGDITSRNRAAIDCPDCKRVLEIGSWDSGYILLSMPW